MANQKKSTRNVSVYSNLANRRRSKKDASSRARAEYLASLPKSPLKRTLHRLHPKRVAGYWFSKKGAFMALKITGVVILLLFLLVGALFAYYRKDLDTINPSTLASRVQTTVTRYYDRNGTLLWEDKGQNNYSIVVKGDQINDYAKKATIAIEDKDFYKHDAVSVNGTIRAALSNAGGGSTQGGSTLTQQLVKQVFFSDQDQNRGLGGIPRKIKEMILSVEVFRIYSRDQILTLYLNEAPYGGPRNGIQSAAKTYFDVDAKNLTLPQAALLAAIPNAPGIYNPYTAIQDPSLKQALLARQHEVLDKMQRQGYITKAQADEAKGFPILDSIKPETSQYSGMQAPHFVQMVQQQLKKQLGAATVGKGGLNVTTTLDLNIQNQLQQNISDIFSGKLTNRNCSYANCADIAGFSNGAGAIEDPTSGQVLALVGSRDFSYPGFGQDNAANAFIQPGSSIKPLVYGQLFQDQGSGNQNYYSGSIIPDVPTTFPGGYAPKDSDLKWKGNITIRNSLDWSRNIPAIKAMQINEKNNPGSTLKAIQAMGDKSYCTNGADQTAGLSLSIGGCGAKLIEHVNALASFARMGSYVPQSYVLKVTNSLGQTLSQFKNPNPQQAINPQAAYVVTDMLGDAKARTGLGWNQDYLPTLDQEGIKTAVKTGTSNAEVNGKSVAKDIWTVGYTPHLAMAVWLGNPDTTPLKSGNSLIPAMVFDKTMSQASQYLIQKGDAKASDWFNAPTGIQKIGNEVAPSYYNKSQATTSSMMTFDKVSKKVATNCTPEGARVQLAVTKITDPATKKAVLTAPDGYDANSQDDVHNCSDAKPSIGSITPNPSGGGAYNISVTVAAGANPLQSLAIQANGQTVSTINISGSGTYSASYTPSGNSPVNITATATDQEYYTASSSITFTPSSSGR